MPGTSSNAATSGISVVPGFVKQTSTPDASADSIRRVAPFAMVTPVVVWTRTVVSTGRPGQSNDVPGRVPRPTPRGPLSCAR